MSAEIDHLFEHPEHLPVVACWIYDAFWRDEPGYSVGTLEALLRQADDPEKIPLSLVALIDGKPIGTVNVVHNDSPSRPHLHPWLAALFVAPEHRRRGAGRALCRAACEEARRLGESVLYLGTDIPGFYSALGAEVYEEVAEGAYVMRFHLGPRRLSP